MGLFNLMGVYCIIPVTIYLTISFFVLFVVGKTDSKNLKIFGNVIAVLLWVSALLILIAGIWMMTTGDRPWNHCCKMDGRSMMHMKMMGGMKDKGGSPAMHPMMRR
ncbi:MAG: hypothetical protein NTZ10_03640 [Candidatus Saganbacteria bacterium]|nr:hypothetical protein [Candidatus Saganbacteria bacterium]